jgi:two-component system sensor kinase FixL
MAHLVNSAADAIIVLLPDRTVRFLNTAAGNLLGFTVGDIGRRPEELWLPSDAIASYEQAIMATVGGQDAEQFESIWHHKNGTLVKVSVSISAIRDNDRMIGISLIVRDGRTELIDVVIHELASPLTMISLLAESIQNNGTDLGTTGRNIIEQVDRATAIMQRMRTGPRRRVVQINELIREAADLALTTFKPMNIETAIELDDHATTMSVDAPQIAQVLTNLIRNSIEAMREQGGRLVISSKQGVDWLDISVADDGPGVSPEIADKLFQSFVTTKVTGMGIGLSLSQKIVRAHGGELLIGPQRNIGVCFIIRLPIEPGGA